MFGGNRFPFSRSKCRQVDVIFEKEIKIIQIFFLECSKSEAKDEL